MRDCHVTSRAVPFGTRSRARMTGSSATALSGGRFDKRRKTHQQAQPAERPLWLTEEEAQTLAVLCSASPGSGGGVEQALFEKLGTYLRAF